MWRLKKCCPLFCVIFLAFFIEVIAETTENPVVASSEGGLEKKETILLSVLLGVPAAILLCLVVRIYNPLHKLSEKLDRAEEERRRLENERIKALVRKTYRKHSIEEKTPVVVIKAAAGIEENFIENPTEPYSPIVYANDIDADYQGMCAPGECCQYDHLWAAYYADHPEEYAQYYDYYFLQPGHLAVDDDGFFVEPSDEANSSEKLFNMANLEMADEIRVEPKDEENSLVVGGTTGRTSRAESPRVKIRHEVTNADSEKIVFEATVEMNSEDGEVLRKIAGEINAPPGMEVASKKPATEPEISSAKTAKCGGKKAVDPEDGEQGEKAKDQATKIVSEDQSPKQDADIDISNDYEESQA
ncbi:hypothetical protein CAPTEDRAFT_205698 [Capitella teleta]|uniref:Uncharacterized protein n=1 Tax=Capitella teleta TaxID=283909 RepID=R7VLJ8_CAPTE|nr:hypothetical protein CAPTEDRAFT_205698 [Capitella teleta]|eukprot:ELU18346.1 hypothetical protein CAPTEDRAFT_205698 [Capitella teleta]